MYKFMELSAKTETRYLDMNAVEAHKMRRLGMGKMWLAVVGLMTVFGLFAETNEVDRAESRKSLRAIRITKMRQSAKAANSNVLTRVVKASDCGLSSSTGSGGRLLGRVFRTDDFGEMNVSHVVCGGTDQAKYDSDRILADNCYQIVGDKVPKPFHRMMLKITPKTRVIYNVSGDYVKPKGVGLENAAFKTVWNRCGYWINSEVGAKPDNKLTDSNGLAYVWNDSDCYAYLGTGRQWDRIRFIVTSEKLTAQAYDECPTGYADMRKYAEQVEQAKAKVALAEASVKVDAERKWYQAQLAKNNLIEYTFKWHGGNSFLVLIADYRNPLKMAMQRVDSVRIQDLGESLSARGSSLIMVSNCWQFARTFTCSTGSDSEGHRDYIDKVSIGRQEVALTKSSPRLRLL